MPALVAIMFLGYLLFIRPEQRRSKEQKSLLDNLKKNDRVVTIGGIYGVVTNVQREQDRVTLKVDEANNMSIRVTFGAVARILAEESAEEKPAKT